MKVIAKEPGFYGVLRERGEVFEFDVEADAKRPWKRDEDNQIVRDDAGTPVQDEEGEPILPSWVEEATEDTVAGKDLPLNHPALDEEGRPFLYTSPGVPPSQAKDVAP